MDKKNIWFFLKGCATFKKIILQLLGVYLHNLFYSKQCGYVCKYETPLVCTGLTYSLIHFTCNY